MTNSCQPLEPSLRQLISSDALSETLVVFGNDLLDRPVIEIAVELNPPPAAGALLVMDAVRLETTDLTVLRDVAAIALPGAYQSSGRSPAPSAIKAATGVEIKAVLEFCQNHDIPLLLIPGFTDYRQAGQDIRLAFSREIKKSARLIYNRLIDKVLSDGLDGIVDSLAQWLGRPVIVENSEFEILAGKEMSPTPQSQRKQIKEHIQTEKSARQSGGTDFQSQFKPVKAARRLVAPVFLGDSHVGYISTMVRAADDFAVIAEYLMPGAAVASVGFSLRFKEYSPFAHAQLGLLKDLLAGRVVSAVDLDRIEQYFGFDLYDGFFVFAVDCLGEPENDDVRPEWPKKGYVSVEIEGTRAFVVPVAGKEIDGLWRKESEDLRSVIARDNPTLKVQIGCSRPALSIADLPESYREARQALVVGTMISDEKEFVLSYADLGVRRLLYQMIDHPELDRFYQETMSRLDAYDEEWETELVETLRVYLKEGANLNSAARELHVHRHTLRYRLEQIAEILKVDIDSEEVLLNLQIAFLIKEMKGKLPG